MGVARNVLLIKTADAVIALPGGPGTLSEVALALNTGKPCVDLGGWKIEGTIPASTAEEAVSLALKLCGAGDGREESKAAPAK
jgi:predicted Rossmann-fold nucleotide-binding protein